MHVLILNNDPSHGALLSSACKKLGFRAVLRATPEEVVSAIADGEADAVLIDLGTYPTEVHFAHRLQAFGKGTLVGFSTGSCQDNVLLMQAKSLGPVLPKVWTHTDLRKILVHFQEEFKRPMAKLVAADAQMSSVVMIQNTPAVGTGVNAARQFDRSDTVADEFGLAGGTNTSPSQKSYSKSISQSPPSTPRISQSPPSKPRISQPSSAASAPSVDCQLPRVNIACRDWHQVQRLCHEASRGRRSIKVRTRAIFTIGQDVAVALALPDEMVVSIVGQVQRRNGPAIKGKTPYELELVGFGNDEMSYLIGRASDALAGADDEGILTLDTVAPQSKVEEEPITIDNMAPIEISQAETPQKIPRARDSIPYSMEDAGATGSPVGDARISWGPSTGKDNN